MEEQPPPSDTNADAPIRPPSRPATRPTWSNYPSTACSRPSPGPRPHCRGAHPQDRPQALPAPPPPLPLLPRPPPLFLIVSVLTLAAVTARSTHYRPLTPSFHVTYIRAYNLTNNLILNSNPNSYRAPEFRVGIRAGNRNPWLTMNYCGGGAASLEFKEWRVGMGRAPAAINVNDEGNANFTVCLAGNGTAALPAAAKERLGSDGEKFMELAMDLTVEVRSLLRNEELKLQIFCDFKVRNSLAKNAKISWQSCVIGL